MLGIIVPGVESWDSEKQMFVSTPDTHLQLEHSLVTLSKWESKHLKPFLTDDEKTSEEVTDYIRCMSLSGEIPDEVFGRFTAQNSEDLNNYINSKMSATWFNETAQPRSYHGTSVVTSELMYHWLVALQIPWEAQYWHLNRLITLVKTINEKNKEATDTKKKAPTTADLENRRALMEKRRREAEQRAAG